MGIYAINMTKKNRQMNFVGRFKESCAVNRYLRNYNSCRQQPQLRQNAQAFSHARGLATCVISLHCTSVIQANTVSKQLTAIKRHCFSRQKDHEWRICIIHWCYIDDNDVNVHISEQWTWPGIGRWKMVLFTLCQFTRACQRSLWLITSVRTSSGSNPVLRC